MSTVHPSRVLDSLPDELLLLIFAFTVLTPMDHAHLSSTCRRFRRLTEDSSLWRDVSLEPFRSVVDDATIQILVKTKFAAADPAVVRLQSLDISKCSNVTDVSVGWIARGCPGLVRLDLSECVKIGDWALLELGMWCRRLRDLRIKLCADITDVGIEALVTGKRPTSMVDSRTAVGVVSPLSPVSPTFGEENLERENSDAAHSQPFTSTLCALDASWCDKLTDAALEHIGMHCPGMSSLKLSFGSSRITDRGISSLLSPPPPSTPVDLALNLSPDGTDASDKPENSLSSPSSNHPLRVLELAMCQSLTSFVLVTLTYRAPRLHTLVITWCDRISPDAVSAFRRKRPECSVQYNEKII